jgi:hypothetical protein
MSSLSKNILRLGDIIALKKYRTACNTEVETVRYILYPLVTLLFKFQCIIYSITDVLAK